LGVDIVCKEKGDKYKQKNCYKSDLFHGRNWMNDFYSKRKQKYRKESIQQAVKLPWRNRYLRKTGL
jgi:hypothetical protein